MGDISKETELPLLAAIEIEPGEITFDPAVSEYTIKLEEGTQRMLIRARTQDTDARYTVSDTDLLQGRNEITITVTGADGRQNIYRLHVIVGEEIETEAAKETTEGILDETAGQEEITDQLSASQVQVQQTASGDSFLDYMLTGKTRYISMGICGCAAFALLLWIVFVIKRIRTRRETMRQKEERALAKQEREKRYEMARIQQEELLRQIDELKKKSRANGKESASGLRIIHLDDEAEDEYEEDYDDIDEYDDEEDSDDN